MTAARRPSPEAILAPLERLGARLGLDRPRALLAALGHPQRRYPVVLVAGTNGKGSTAALLAAMSTAAGYRTGLYTSPHLESVRERLRVDGVAVGADELAGLLERVLAVAPAGESPTYFETLTVAAMVGFAEREVELAVLEVGLGGRLDATNAADPMLSLVTDLALDHRELLGDTVEEIAREKAGIVRRGRAALASVGDPAAWRALADAATERGAKIESVRDRSMAQAVAAPGEVAGERITEVDVTTPRGNYRSRLRLAGDHQLPNLALAVEAAEALAVRGFDRLGRRAIESGIAACRWPGRLERVVLPGGGEALLDAAHNPAGARALARHLADLGEPYDLLFGVLADKEGGAMLAELAPRAGRLVLTAPPSPRARSPERLRTGPAAAAWVIDDWEAALEAALGPVLEPASASEPPGSNAADAAPSARRLVVCGSLYLVGAARRGLWRRFGVPLPAAEIATYDPAPVDRQIGPDYPS